VASPITDYQVPLGVSLANYNASNLPVTYGNPVSGSNVLTVQNAAAAGWVTGEGIYIPSVTSVGPQPGSGVTCDNVTVSGNTITMLNVGGSACNAPASWNPANFSVPVLHFNMGHGAITSGSNVLTTTAPTFVSGQGIMVKGAGAAGADLICPVISVSGSTFTLFQSNGSTACNAGTTVTVAQVFHDDTYALQQTLAAAAAWPGAQVHIPTGTYFLSSETDIVNPMTVYGDGPYQSIFVSDEDAIDTIVTKTSGVKVQALGIYGAENFTPTSGTLLRQCDGSSNCWNDYYSGLYLYGGWTEFALYGNSLQGSLAYSTLHKPQHVAIYVDNPQGDGDFNFDGVIGVNCSSCGNGATGILIDQADTNAWSHVKMNAFATNLSITGAIGIVDHQRFDNPSFEGGAVSITKSGSNNVYSNQINGGELELPSAALTVGNGVLQQQLNGIIVAGGANCFDLAGQQMVVTGNTFTGCTGDGVRLETTATGSVSANTFLTIGGYGINNKGTAASAIQQTANLFSGTTSGDVSAGSQTVYLPANNPGGQALKVTNTATSPGGYAAYFASTATGANLYATLVTQGQMLWQGNKDATPSEAISFAYGVPGALAGNNPYFNFYNGTAWAEAWHIDSATGNLNVKNTLLAPSLLATGIVDGTTPTTTTTTTPVTLGGTYHSGYTFNNDGATAVTYTLPTAAAGLQYCVANYTGATGTLKVATSATGQFIDNAGANTATGGYVISGGALGDAGCFIGMDATHWKLYIQAGTWTTH
jgi:hypothetical protein